MEILNDLILGFGLALSWNNLMWCLIGVTVGTLVGVLPGLGPMAAMSLLLPLTYGLGDATASIIFMAGLYYGTQYGGSTTSILLKLPGEAASVVTCIDGHAMAQKGRGGAALAIAALSSFFAGTVATFLIMLVAKPLSNLSLVFGPTEYASLMILGILASVVLSTGSYLKGTAVALLGILLGIVGTDINSGMVRFDLGSIYLMDGISFAVMVMGVFGMGEVLFNLLHTEKNSVGSTPISSLYPNRQEIRQSVWPALRGTALGSFLGILPGGGALISSFASYVVEKKLSRNPKLFGQGDPAGVAGPEAANNAGAQTSFIPMLALGIPITPIMGLMLAVLIINGIQPGPHIISSNEGLFWALIASMWIGNFFLLILNLPLIAIWVSVLRIKWQILYPLIIAIACFGVYSINNSWFDLLLLLVFGVFGYLMRVLNCSVAPLAMGFIVGALFEEYLRRTLIINQGDWMVFLERPISLTFLIVSLLFVIIGTVFKRKSQ